MFILQYSYIKSVLDNPFVLPKPVSRPITHIATETFLLKNILNHSLMRTKVPREVDMFKKEAKRTYFLR